MSTRGNLDLTVLTYYRPVCFSQYAEHLSILSVKAPDLKVFDHHSYTTLMYLLHSKWYQHVVFLVRDRDSLDVYIPLFEHTMVTGEVGKPSPLRRIV